MSGGGDVGEDKRGAAVGVRQLHRDTKIASQRGAQEMVMQTSHRIWLTNGADSSIATH
jgi:hypothetical protein